LGVWDGAVLRWNHHNRVSLTASRISRRQRVGPKTSLVIMSFMPKNWVRALSLLLVAALVIGPVVIVAQAVSMSEVEHAAFMNDPAPCDGCDTGAPSLSCVMICAGFVGAVATIDQQFGSFGAADRVTPVLHRQLAGRECEPDKPPPKLIPA
jgi:hypothetical protein